MMWLFALLGLCLTIALDQMTKLWALTQLKPVGTMPFWDKVLHFTFVENRGAAFGILSGRRWFFVALTVVIAIAVTVAFAKMPKNKPYQWLRFAMVLVLGGAIGNAIDRLIRGYVVDFLEFSFVSFPVFNLADIFVVCGTVLAMILILFFIKEES